jgi:hypothetical protein
MQDRVTSGIKTFALVAFGGYVAWNATWILCGRIPPSIFTYFTGLPCPTTGMTRSIESLIRGDLRQFILFNPLTLIYLGLTATSAIMLAKRKIQDDQWALPSVMALIWFASLALGWLVKFAIGSKYW